MELFSEEREGSYRPKCWAVVLKEIPKYNDSLQLTIYSSTKEFHATAYFCFFLDSGSGVVYLMPTVL